ncbi:hypothetical protein ACWIGW_05095 [Nocardia brasiliensis]
MVSLGIIGIGEQTRRTHLPCVEFATELGHEISLVAVADFAHILEARHPEVTHCGHDVMRIPVPWSTPGTFTDATADKVIADLLACGVDTVIVATEPLSHFPYVRALERAGIRYLVDKPFICRPDISRTPAAADQAVSDLNWLHTRAREQREHGHMLGSVNITRRFDRNLAQARHLVHESAEQTGQGVTHVSVTYCDGERRDVEGCRDQEQHPFKYGYGGLNHSGYHAIDTAVWMSGHDFPTDEPTKIEVQTLSRSVSDYLDMPAAQVNSTPSPADARTYPTEYDSVVNVRLSRNGRVTLLSLAIIHDSTTNRRWQTAQSIDQALHLGRLSHESLTVTQGELQTVMVRMVEIPHTAADADTVELPARISIGDITRNPLFAAQLGSPVFEQIGGPMPKRSLAESAKWAAFRNFVAKANGEQYDSNIDMDRHLVSQLVLLLAARSHADDGAVQTTTVLDWVDGRAEVS